MKQLNLTTPLTKEQIKKLSVGNIIYLSGTIFTARDKAHQRILEFLKEGKKLPFNLKDGIIFHAGPLTKKKNQQHKKWKIMGIGPTTSSRMNSFTPEIISKFKIKAIIGKGGMNKEVSRAMMKNSCIYLAMIGGCSAITTKKIKQVKNIYWKDLSLAEAVWELEVEKLGPLILAIDAKGNSLYMRKFLKELSSQQS